MLGGGFLLFTFHYSLDVIQFIECFERREVVHIKMEDFVTNLTQHRVVELEEGELRRSIGNGTG